MLTYDRIVVGRMTQWREEYLPASGLIVGFENLNIQSSSRELGIICELLRTNSETNVTVLKWVNSIQILK